MAAAPPVGPPALRAAGIAYARSGRGPALLLVHGLGSARSVWRPVVDWLAAERDVIAVDLPGFGQSPPLPRRTRATPDAYARRLARFCDALGLDEVHVAGNSLGGWVALELAARGRATSVTALAPAGLWGQAGPRFARQIMRISRAAARACAPCRQSLLRRRGIRRIGLVGASARPGDVAAQDAIAAVAAMAYAPGFRAALRATRGEAFRRASSVRVPVTIAFGDRDRVLPQRQAQVRALAPHGARWVILPDCGHIPMWDAPTATVDLILRTSG